MFKELYYLDTRRDSNEVSQEEFDRIFHLLDKDGNGSIQKDEFMDLFEVYEIWKYY